ncbi:hypothetical protein Taro_055971 [Colocasia esculenta]|uniref:Uncharacterized protein n=1 Tax=Colocasia esculenta TaxID=4460 RepID=A0A843XUY4_COLES|nr:hypothetical protein [Colocasia esculenta]
MVLVRKLCNRIGPDGNYDGVGTMTPMVHEKEFLLKDLTVEGLLGNEDRRLGEVCSKRVYRVLMAENGGMKTDDVENGADFFGY